jgi:arylsulfatase A-like enzyme
MSTYKIPLVIASALFAVFLISCDQHQRNDSSTGNEQPNIILLMGDDHGWDEVGYNGHPHVKTPVLDDMASTGLRFDRFYSGHPSCSPTRGSFMTGRHPNRYGTFSPNWSIRPEEVSIAHILGEAGYASAHFGKWHLGPVKKDSPTSPGAMGFDEWLSHDNFFELDPVLSRNGEAPKQIDGEGSQILIDEAIAFIRKTTENEQPFFVVVWYGSPHEPYSGLPEDLSLYDELLEKYDDQRVRLTSNETGQRVERPLGEVLRERYAEITAMDRSMGALRNYLKEAGLRDNTLLWYCGDNGTPPSAARTGMTLRGQKGTMYEGGIRVPGVIEWPGRIGQASVTSFSSVTSDILPTLCELTGSSLPGRPLDGVSLVPVIDENMQVRTEPIFFWSFESGKAFDEHAQPYIDPQLQEGTTPLAKIMDGKFTRSFRNFKYDEVSEDHLGGARVMMNGKYKLLIEAESSNSPIIELFDITVDPGEANNIIDEHPDIVSSMQQELADWQLSVLNSLTGADY